MLDEIVSVTPAAAMFALPQTQTSTCPIFFINYKVAGLACQAKVTVLVDGILDVAVRVLGLQENATVPRGG